MANRLNHNYTILPCGISYIKANEWRGEVNRELGEDIIKNYCMECGYDKAECQCEEEEDEKE